MHGGMSPGAPKGNKNAFKHGHYTAEAIASRREIAKLLRDARALVKRTREEGGSEHNQPAPSRGETRPSPEGMLAGMTDVSAVTAMVSAVMAIFGK
jgi:hypothetical protein